MILNMPAIEEADGSVGVRRASPREFKQDPRSLPGDCSSLRPPEIRGRPAILITAC